VCISNDVDGLNIDDFYKIHNFFSEKKIQISHSVWFFAHNSSNSLNLFDVDNQSKIKKNKNFDLLIRSIEEGIIDTNHSWGNFSSKINFDRSLIEQAFKLYDIESLKLPIYTNHGNTNNIQNIGENDYMQGNKKNSNAYHFDLTKKISYLFWDGKMSTKIFDENIFKYSTKDKVFIFSRWCVDKTSKKILWFPESLLKALELISNEINNYDNENVYFTIIAQHLAKKENSKLILFNEKSKIYENIDNLKKKRVFFLNLSDMFKKFFLLKFLNYELKCDNKNLIIKFTPKVKIDLLKIKPHDFNGLYLKIKEFDTVEAYFLNQKLILNKDNDLFYFRS
jgi:hypothetical protein